VVWDGAPIHRSGRVRDFAAGTGGRLVLERLPAQAPELNPVEYLRAHLKERELGNLLVRHAHELGHHATAALRRLRRRPKIIAACRKQSSLPP
jgi:transposase